MYNARLFCGTKCSAFHRGDKLGTKISYHRQSRCRSCGKRVATARKQWYIFSPNFVQIATFLTCNASVRHYLFWINAECICRRHFHNYSLFFVLFLPNGASKAKIVWHLTSQCCYKFWLWIFLFCNLFFQNSYFKFFFPKFIFQDFFFQLLFFKIFVL